MKFWAELRINDRSESPEKIAASNSSNRSRRGMAETYLQERDYFGELLDLDGFVTEIEQGLYFESTIPSGYGMGSSGALCAAVYHRFARNPITSSFPISSEQIVKLQALFIRMESPFHGKSSGIDPLIIYLNQPILVNQDKRLTPCHPLFSREGEDEVGGELLKIFLIDSGHPSGTGKLVNHFMKSFAPGGEITSEGSNLITLSNRCIETFMSAQAGHFLEEIKKLSQFQLQNLRQMIPEKMFPIWEEGLEEDLYYLKLCGSGGGGFITGFTLKPEVASDFLNQKSIKTIQVNLEMI